MSQPLLMVDKLNISFGGLRAVSDFSLRVMPCSLAGLIGPNGAGKTTVFNLITGVYVPESGTIRLGDRRIDGKKPYQIASAGLSRTFQNIRLFKELSVLDNLRVACHLRASHHGMLQAVLRTPGFRREEQAIRDKSMALLSLFGLEKSADVQARNLCYGEQRRLEILRAIATDPKLILLDEPAAGLNPAEKDSLARSIREIRDRFKLTILLIEHDMNLVMGLCEHITVLDHGEIIATGSPAEIQSNSRVIEAYLGEE